MKADHLAIFLRRTPFAWPKGHHGKKDTVGQVTFKKLSGGCPLQARVHSWSCSYGTRVLAFIVVKGIGTVKGQVV
ncbi:hypothetical protein ACQP3C_29365, partial [Escherichia coli]